MRRSIRPGENVSAVITGAVAEQTGRDPTDLQPLGDSIDPDALDSLFHRSPGDAVESSTLIYEGYRITIDRETIAVQEVPGPSKS